MKVLRIASAVSLLLVSLTTGCGESIRSRSAAIDPSSTSSPLHRVTENAGTRACNLDDEVLHQAQDAVRQYQLIEPEIASDIRSLISLRKDPRVLEGLVERVQRVERRRLTGFESIEAQTGGTAYWTGVELAVVGPEGSADVPVVLRTGGAEVLRVGAPPESAYKALETLVGACAVVVNGQGDALSVDAPAVVALSGRSGAPVALTPETAEVVSTSGSLPLLAEAMREAIARQE